MEENDEGLSKISYELMMVFVLLDLYRRINALKIRNPELKILLGIGGWNMKSHAFSTMVHSTVKRRNFIFDTIK